MLDCWREHLEKTQAAMGEQQALKQQTGDPLPVKKRAPNTYFTMCSHLTNEQHLWRCKDNSLIDFQNKCPLTVLAAARCHGLSSVFL